MPDRRTRALRSIPDVKLLTAQYVGANTDGTVRVDFGQGSVPVTPVGATKRTPGEQVQVLQVNGVAVVLGPAQQISPYGVVTAVNTDTVTVDVGTGTPVDLPWLAGAYPSPAVHDEVAILGGIVLGPPTTIPDNGYVDPGNNSGTGTVTQEFRASDSGTWYVPGSKYNRDDVYAVGTGNNIGAWFYGTLIADTIPDTATINSVEIYLHQLWSNFPSTPTGLGLHTHASKSGAPTPSSVTGVATGSGWRSLPTPFGDALKTGSKLGISTGTSGEAMYAGRIGSNADPDSGKLRITYTT